MSLREVSVPAAEPVSLVAAKAHLRVEFTDDDVLITSMIGSARGAVEDYCRRPLVGRVFEYRRHDFPGVLYLPKPPLAGADWVKYIDDAGALQTLSSAVYDVTVASEPGAVQPAYGQTWPALRGDAEGVRVQFRAGFIWPFTVDSSTDVLTAVNHPFSDGDPVPLSNSGGALPAPLMANTTYYARDVTGDTLKLAATSGGVAIDITNSGTETHFLGVMPPALSAALLLILGNLYENRESVVIGTIAAELPMGVKSLLMPLVYGDP